MNLSYLDFIEHLGYLILKKLNLWSFSCYFFRDAFILLFYLSFTFEIPVMCMLVCKMVFHSSLRFCSFFLIIFFCLFRLEKLYWPLFKWAVFCLMPVQIWCWTLLWIFHFSIVLFNSIIPAFKIISISLLVFPNW